MIYVETDEKEVTCAAVLLSLRHTLFNVLDELTTDVHTPMIA